MPKTLVVFQLCFSCFLYKWEKKFWELWVGWSGGGVWVGVVGGWAVAGDGRGGRGWLCWDDVENKNNSCTFIAIFVLFSFYYVIGCNFLIFVHL